MRKGGVSPYLSPWSVGAFTAARAALYVTLVVFIAAEVCSRVASLTFQVWDDGFMVVRYARNLLTYGGIIWNPEGPPVYGATSALYVFWMALFKWKIAASIPTAFFASVSAGVVYLALLIYALESRINASHLAKTLGVGVAVCVAVAARRQLAVHFESGMDSTFALAFVIAFILWADVWAKSLAPKSRSSALMGVFGGLLYSVRPDLTVFPAAVFGAIFALSIKREQRHAAAFAGSVFVAGVILQMAAAYVYFGSPTPLAFFVKSLGVYGAAMKQVYGGESRRRLWEFLVVYWPCFAIIGGGVIHAGLKRDRSDNVVDASLVLGVVLFMAYYTFGPLQIMPFEARFYYPVAPVLLFVSARCAARMLDGVPSFGQTAPVGLSFLVLCACLSGLFVGSWKLSRCVSRLRTANYHLGFNLSVEYLSRYATMWPALEQTAPLPDDCVIAATEVGRLGVFNPTKRIVDLTGLNDTNTALHGFSSERLLVEQSPDIIYTPHPDYAEMLKSITSHPLFSARYDYYPASELGTILGIAVKKAKDYPNLRDRLSQMRRPE